jgi:GTPase SAR1 family protein
MEGNPIKCKIVLLGDQSVGKTSIINRFIFDNFTGHEQVYLLICLANCWCRFRVQNCQRR